MSMGSSLKQDGPFYKLSQDEVESWGACLIVHFGII